VAKELRTTLQLSENPYINKSKDKGKAVEVNPIAEMINPLAGWKGYLNEEEKNKEEDNIVQQEGTLFSNLTPLTTTPPKLIVPVPGDLRTDHHTNTSPDDDKDEDGDVAMKVWSNTPWSNDDME
jgi:hypothetical protein